MRGGVLVGVITRANYPHKRIACGYYTRWAPITVSGRAREAVASNDVGAPVHARRRARVHRHHVKRSRAHRRHHHARRTRRHEAKTQTFDWFGGANAEN